MSEENIVAVIDDHAGRELLCRMLNPLLIAVQAYASVQDFLDDPRSRACGCLVLDVRMPGISGIDLQRRLLEIGWNIPLVFVTAHGDVPIAVEAMRLGAADFLQKPVNEQQLIDSIQRALESSKQRRQQRRVTDAIAARVACLTPRELEVLDLLKERQRSKDIALALKVSLKTVEEYRSNVLRKMHVASTNELLAQLSANERPHTSATHITAPCRYPELPCRRQGASEFFQSCRSPALGATGSVRARQPSDGTGCKA